MMPSLETLFSLKKFFKRQNTLYKILFQFVIHLLYLSYYLILILYTCLWLFVFISFKFIGMPSANLGDLLSTVYCRQFFNIKNNYIKYKKEESWYFLSFTNMSKTLGKTSTVNSSSCMKILFMKWWTTHSQHNKIINS